MSKLVACIMAGGVGSRFWPASTEEQPKQFLDILGLGRSLLQLTYDRYCEIGLTPEDIWVITSEKYLQQVREQLPEVPDAQIVGEPDRRNTAPAAYLGTKLIQDKIGEAIVIMAPSDHHIEDAEAFKKVINKGRQFLETENALITIGIQPDFPHTGYGYIAFDKIDQPPYKVSDFTEKPDLEKATIFLESGKYLWNAGIFMWRTSSLNEAFEKHAADIKNTIDLHVKSTNGRVNQDTLKIAFDNLRDASIDVEIMERADIVYTIPANMKWSDLGSWKSLYDKSTKDEQNNVNVSNKSLIKKASGNLIYAPGKQVIVHGLDNFMIIDDNGTIVISPLSSNQEIKVWRNEFLNDD